MKSIYYIRRKRVEKLTSSQRLRRHRLSYASLTPPPLSLSYQPLLLWTFPYRCHFFRLRAICISIGNRVGVAPETWLEIYDEKKKCTPKVHFILDFVTYIRKERREFSFIFFLFLILFVKIRYAPLFRTESKLPNRPVCKSFVFLFCSPCFKVCVL